MVSLDIIVSVQEMVLNQKEKHDTDETITAHYLNDISYKITDNGPLSNE